jgi:hypothetical protein
LHGISGEDNFSRRFVWHESRRNDGPRGLGMRQGQNCSCRQLTCYSDYPQENASKFAAPRIAARRLQKIALKLKQSHPVDK